MHTFIKNVMKKSPAMLTMSALMLGAFGFSLTAYLPVAHAATTYTLSQEGLPGLINPSATTVDVIEAFIKTPGVTFANPGFTDLDTGWSASTINPTYTVEYGTASTLVTEHLSIDVGAPTVVVNYYVFTGCSTQPTTPCTSAQLTDGYQVTYTNGDAGTSWSPLPGGTSAAVTDLAAENTTPPAPLPSVATNDATAITSTDATLNGTNGSSDASGHSFWVSASTFSTASPTLPTGVYSTPDLGAIGSNTSFSALLSSVAGLPAATPNTTYYFAAWSNVGGTWYPGSVMSFTTADVVTPTAPIVSALSPSTGSVDGGDSVTITGTGFTGATSVDFGSNPATNVVVNSDTSITATAPAGTGTADVTVTTPLGTSVVGEADQFTYVLTGIVTGGEGVLHVDSITSSEINANGTADGTYADGWQYNFHITVPTNEPNVAMKFADWLNGSNILPVANNMQISSAQANNSDSWIPVTEANVYTTPNLTIVTDNDPSTPGIQADIVVDVKIPSGTVNGSYSTSYGIKSE
jgi:hypothetical protein